jgi:hypothetical protein
VEPANNAGDEHRPDHTAPLWWDAMIPKHASDRGFGNPAAQTEFDQLAMDAFDTPIILLGQTDDEFTQLLVGHPPTALLAQLGFLAAPGAHRSGLGDADHVLVEVPQIIR